MANYSCMLTTTPTLIMSAASSRRSYLRIDNIGSGTIYISYMINNPGVNVPGSIAIPAGGRELYSSQDNDESFIPEGEIWGVAVSGTSALTVQADR